MARNKKNFVAIPFSVGVPLGALADLSLVSLPLVTFGEDIFVISVDMNVAWKGAAGGEGPVELGIDHGDLTNTEVIEALEAELTDPDDIIARERARRPVRRFGFCDMVTQDGVHNDGRTTRVPVRFSVGDGKALEAFALNRSGGPLTPGVTMSFNGTIFGRWQR